MSRFANKVWSLRHLCGVATAMGGHTGIFDITILCSVSPFSSVWTGVAETPVLPNFAGVLTAGAASFQLH